MKQTLLLACLTALAACSGADQASVERAVVQGQLFCAKAQASGPLVVALADAAGVPISVTGRTASAVAAACAAIGAIPVSPPAAPSQAPIVAAPVVLAPVKV